jgi:hypothetical protein
MGYAKIQNLYRPEAQTVLLFRECYALEKIHGTSAHVAMAMGSGGGIGLLFHSGGEKHERFVGLFDSATLRERFAAMGHNSVVAYGEAYGGSQQKQAWRYGPQLKFVAFDVLAVWVVSVAIAATVLPLVLIVLTSMVVFALVPRTSFPRISLVILFDP